jgi:hypothetical protein
MFLGRLKKLKEIRVLTFKIVQEGIKLFTFVKKETKVGGNKR